MACQLAAVDRDRSKIDIDLHSYTHPQLYGSDGIKVVWWSPEGTTILSRPLLRRPNKRRLIWRWPTLSRLSQSADHTSTKF